MKAILNTLLRIEPSWFSTARVVIGREFPSCYIQCSLLRETELVRFEFVRAEKANFPVAMLCRTLRASRSGHYAWLKRPKSLRVQQDEKLAEEIRRAHIERRERYGSPRIHRI